MKSLCIIMVMLATTAFAEDVLLFKGGITFNHLKHQTKNGGVCTACHSQEPGKIAAFGKEWAHKNCIECHDTFGEGPTKCGECHKGDMDKSR